MGAGSIRGVASGRARPLSVSPSSGRLAVQRLQPCKAVTLGHAVEATEVLDELDILHVACEGKGQQCKHRHRLTHVVRRESPVADRAD